MPNYVHNIIKIRSKNDDPQDIINFINQHYNENGLFDFNTFICEPLSEGDCPDEYNFNTQCGELKALRTMITRETLENPPQRDWFNWLEWRRKYWGTKWNAGEESKCYWDLDKIQEYYSYNSPLIIYFKTAWHAPFPIFEQLFKTHNELDISIIYYSTENSEFGEFFTFFMDNDVVNFCHYDLENYTEEEIKNE